MDYRITANESKVLSVWSEIYDKERSIITLSQISAISGFYRPRRYVRALARKGLLVLRPMFDEQTALLCGSGYSPTEDGWRMIDEDGARSPDVRHCARR